MTELPIHFDPAGVETDLYNKWDKAGCFMAHPQSGKPTFSIVIPPPNVTGVLHMGHALDNLLQDILSRYKRMDGFEVLWLPGTDHAGIATQMVVERQLAKEGTNRHALGREEFEKRVWAWKKESGAIIIGQLRRLGASCDWSRERFTLDEGLSAAVRKVFVSLYKEKLIYRSDYLISWSPALKTAISDLEVEHKDVNGFLTYFKYEAEDGSFTLEVATTRPETILGDTALAVNNADERYQAYVGKRVKHPFSDRFIPVIADEAVKKEFGTGVVKVTPAHDPVDYDMGKRHHLPMLTILDEDAKIDFPNSPFHGQDRFKARAMVIEALKEKNLFIKSEPYVHSVGHCQRSGVVVEPRISTQWFVKISDLAKPALDAVKKGNTQFVPEFWTKTYVGWMENIRDWCISRQLWWGHRIPVWYCQDCKHQNVSEIVPTECEKCQSKDLQQDTDVLDTWFSSALWPFSTMGWPEQTADLKAFYPTSVLVTGFDIIFFWVARMMMMGLKFMQEVPFKTVHIHALVRDEHGQKMSKSKGNVMDPLVVMDQFGTDAFRFALASFAVQGRDIPLSIKRIEGYRNFITKLWNASRFSFSQGAKLPTSGYRPQTLAQTWINHRLHETTNQVRAALDDFRFNEAADAIYHFVWDDFCDWYLEISKIEMKEASAVENAQMTLGHILDQVYRLLHPISPFVTESLWQKLHATNEFLMLSAYPKNQESRFEAQAIKDFEDAKKVVANIRVFRSENKLPPSKKLEAVFIYSSDFAVAQKRATQLQGLPFISVLANVGKFTAVADKSVAMPTLIASEGNLEYIASLQGLINVDDEKKRLEKEIEKFEKDVAFLSARLSAETYRSKAPAHLIEKDEKKLSDARLQLEKFRHEFARLQKG